MEMIALKVNIIFDLLVLLFCVSIIVRLRRYYVAILFMRYRFSFFALRDKLGHLAAEQTVCDDTIEYKFLVNTFNYYIKNTEEIDLLKFLKKHVQFQKNKEHKEQLNYMVDHCRKSHPQAALIMKEFEETVLDILFKHSYLLQYLGFLVKLINALKFPPRIINRMMETNDVIEEQRERVSILATVA